MPKISFIISAFEEMNTLRICLSSLIDQTESSWEAWVMDNTTNPELLDLNRKLCLIDSRINHFSSLEKGVDLPDCYYSSDYGAEYLATGDFLCFASDDSYYCPLYAEKMLAKSEEGYDFIYCDFVWGRKWQGSWSYTPNEARPKMCHFDKTAFIIRKDKMIPFPAKSPDGKSGACDGLLAEELVRLGVRHARVPELLCVHN